ncbi:MAG TPA: hypothetical protein VH475_15190 [Tepidisphaeraceae bacterium]|jgi:hypothetical protein
MRFLRRLLPFALCLLPSLPALAADPQQWLTFEGKDGPGKGKHIVLISGDEEYRSEESMPMLGKLLSERHGFTCTVLFSIDPATGEISPKTANNIPGIEALDSADLLIILTRFRALPDDAMKHVDDYLKAGKPVIGLRTATHAFNGLKGEYEKYNYGYHGDQKEWTQGFGRLVLGETWISHHGAHKDESTRGLFAPGAKGSPLLNGIEDGEIWGPTDVYGVRLPLPGDSKPIILGQSVKRAGPHMSDKQDPFFGMRPTDREPAPTTTDKKTGKTNDKNNPMMPVAWTKSYQLPGGKPGKSFTTTMGSSTDLTNEALRRLIVNAAYYLLDMKVPEKADVTIVGEFHPSAFGFDGHRKGMKPADYAK